MLNEESTSLYEKDTYRILHTALELDVIIRVLFKNRNEVSVGRVMDVDDKYGVIRIYGFHNEDIFRLVDVKSIEFGLDLSKDSA